MSTTNNTFPQMDTTITFIKNITRTVRYAVKNEMTYDDFFHIRQMKSGVVENSDKAFSLRVEGEWQLLLNSIAHDKNDDAELFLDDEEEEGGWEADEEEVTASGLDIEDDAEEYVHKFFSEVDEERHKEFKSRQEDRQEERKRYENEIAELKRRLLKYEDE